MKIIKIITIFFLQLALIGCASYYKAPANQPTATMHFKTNTRPVRFTAFVNEECKPSPHGVRLAYIDPTFARNDKYKGPTQIIANKKIIVTLAEVYIPNYNSNYCSVTVSFTPKEGANYLALYKAVDKGCNGKIVEQVNDKIKPIPDLKYLEKSCYSHND